MISYCLTSNWKYFHHKDGVASLSHDMLAFNSHSMQVTSLKCLELSRWIVSFSLDYPDGQCRVISFHNDWSVIDQYKRCHCICLHIDDTELFELFRWLWVDWPVSAMWKHYLFWWWRMQHFCLSALCYLLFCAFLVTLHKSGQWRLVCWDVITSNSSEDCNKPDYPTARWWK